MYKNQLQELAQRSSCNLPSYSCLREGPDHAPRFKATVNFNGEVFESPGYCSTLRQAEHAAAEVALNVLSQKGPAQSLAAKVLDETGVCKNLLQETAQRAGVMLPVYSTFRTGPGHLPEFTSTVEVAGFRFPGERAKTKKQAEKNAALAAWTSLKKVANYERSSASDHDLSSDEHEQNSIARALAIASSKNLARMSPFSSSSSEERRNIPMSLPSNSVWQSHDIPTKSGMQSPRHVSKPQVPTQQRRAPPQSSSQSPQVTRSGLAIKPGMAYQPRSSSSVSGVSNLGTRTAPKPMSSAPVSSMQRRQVLSAQTEHDADDEIWLRGTAYKRETTVSSHLSACREPDMYSDKIWESNYWGSNDGAISRDSITHHMSVMKSSVTQSYVTHSSVTSMPPPSLGLMPPVRIRSLIPVHASPQYDDEDEDEDDEEEENLRDSEKTTFDMLSQLGL